MMAAPSSFTDTVELPPPENPATWAHIKDVICRGNLDDLYRDPACESAYRVWSKPVKAEWGSLERFIRVVRLEWDDPLKQPSAAGAPSNGNGHAPAEASAASTAPLTAPDANGFFEDLDDEWRVKMIPNHWPYNIPLTCRHWCVWSRKPITHISQLPGPPLPPANASEVAADGETHTHANGGVAPGSPDSIAAASTSSAPADGSKLAGAPHAEPVPWPFPRMSRADQEALYAAVSHDGIRALVLPEDDVRAGPSVAAPVTGEYTLEFFRAHPHLADGVVVVRTGTSSSSSTTTRGATAAAAVAPDSSLEAIERTSPLEAAATRAADAAMAYFAQHCRSFVLKTFPPSQGWRSVLFCNPPHLRTVPGLDHWHIMSLEPGADAAAAPAPASSGI